MPEHLEREIQIATERTCGPDSVASNAKLVGEELLDLSSDESGGLSLEVSALIQRCLDGSEPMPDAKSWHQDKFSARHVNMAMLRAAGFKGGEIAQAMGATASMVSWTLNHPYAKKIIHALMTARGARVLDIRTKLDIYASEILDHTYNLAQKSEDLEAVTRVSFGLLDRAGYNATTKVQQVAPAQGLATESTLRRLSDALNQSELVDAQIMPAYVPKPPPDEGRGEVGSPEQPLDARSVGPGPDAGPLSDGSLRLTKVS